MTTDLDSARPAAVESVGVEGLMWQSQVLGDLADCCESQSLRSHVANLCAHDRVLPLNDGTLRVFQ